MGVSCAAGIRSLSISTSWASRAGALRRVLDEAVASLGSVRGVGVRRVLRALEVERVSVSADVCRDIDTPEDVAWWESFLSN